MWNRDPSFSVLLAIVLLTWQWQTAAVAATASNDQRAPCHHATNTVARSYHHHGGLHHADDASSMHGSPACPAHGCDCGAGCAGCSAPFAAIPVDWWQPHLLGDAYSALPILHRAISPPPVPPERPPRPPLG